MVLLLHGLGMHAKEFEHAFRECLGSYASRISLLAPEADAKPVTYLGGQQQRCWFDIKRVPVPPAEMHDGLWESVEHVHEILRKAEASGIPSDRIVLAGFSQGAVMALAAGLTHEQQLAGICALSGWLPAGLLKQVRNNRTPIFMSHGEEDALVRLSTGLRSAEALRKVGCKRLEFQGQPQLGHQCGHPGQLACFRSAVLSMLALEQLRVEPDAQSARSDASNSIADTELASPRSPVRLATAYPHRSVSVGAPVEGSRRDALLHARARALSKGRGEDYIKGRREKSLHLLAGDCSHQEEMPNKAAGQFRERKGPSSCQQPTLAQGRRPLFTRSPLWPTAVYGGRVSDPSRGEHGLSLTTANEYAQYAQPLAKPSEYGNSVKAFSACGQSFTPPGEYGKSPKVLGEFGQSLAMLREYGQSVAAPSGTIDMFAHLHRVALPRGS